MDGSIKYVVAQIRSLEPFPAVTRQVLELSAREDVGPRELIEVIQTDPAMTARILKLCNSAFYGFRREIASLPEAGVCLGTNALVSLVLTTSTSRYFRELGTGPGEPQRRIWHNCVATALCSRVLVEGYGDVDRERAYTAGLLGHMGHLVLERFLRPQCARIEEACASGADRIEAEVDILGIDHAEIGARLVDHWELPDVLVDAIRHHHRPQEASVDPALCGVLSLADYLARIVESEDAGSLPAPDTLAEAFALAGISPTELESLVGSVQNELTRAQDLLAA